MLSVEGLVIERNEIPLSGPLSFSLSEGDIIHLKGPNGAGKTTLMKTLLGLVSYSKGEINWDRGLSPDEIGYVGHKLALTPELTVKENLCYLQFGENGIGDIDKAIDNVGLSHLSDAFVASLSEGQKKRAALARFYYLKKTLWILDEPLSALDVAHQALFLKMLEAYLARGGMVILSSHQAIALNQVNVNEVVIV